MPDRDHPRKHLTGETRRWLREEISKRRREQAVAAGRLSEGRSAPRSSGRG
jgi:hypothetical protein